MPILIFRSLIIGIVLIVAAIILYWLGTFLLCFIDWCWYTFLRYLNERRRYWKLTPEQIWQSKKKKRDQKNIDWINEEKKLKGMREETKQ